MNEKHTPSVEATTKYNGVVETFVLKGAVAQEITHTVYGPWRQDQRDGHKVIGISRETRLYEDGTFLCAVYMLALATESGVVDEIILVKEDLSN